MGPRLVALGSNYSTPNMLFSRINPNYFPIYTPWGAKVGSGSSLTNELPLISYGKALIRGFQMACNRGPLCAEPMHGVLFVLEELIAQQLQIVQDAESIQFNVIGSSSNNNVADMSSKQPKSKKHLISIGCVNETNSGSDCSLDKIDENVVDKYHLENLDVSSESGFSGNEQLLEEDFCSQV